MVAAIIHCFRVEYRQRAVIDPPQVLAIQLDQLIIPVSGFRNDFHETAQIIVRAFQVLIPGCAPRQAIDRIILAGDAGVIGNLARIAEGPFVDPANPLTVDGDFRIGTVRAFPQHSS